MTEPTDGKEIAAVWVDIDDVTPWDENPRNNEAAIAPVAASIKRFGFASPLIVRRADNVVIAGHTRLLAARSLGLDRVPVRFMDLDPADARLLAIVDNKSGEVADWDDDALATLIGEMDEFDLEFLLDTGFSESDLDGLLSDEEDADGDESDDDLDTVPEVQAKVWSEPGAVYELGPHRILCGDCKDPEGLARLLGGKEINVAFTSPPYASQRTYDESSGFKPIRPEDFSDWFEAVQAGVARHLAADGSWFVNIKEHASDGQRSLYVKKLTIDHVERWQWLFVDEFCWQRPGIPGKFPNRFKNAFEPVFHFARNKGIKLIHENVVIPDPLADEKRDAAQNSSVGSDVHGSVIGAEGANVYSDTYAGALPSNVLKVSGVESGVSHSAMFPTKLPGWFIKAFSEKGDLIFDPFMGSGTTLIAAATEGRVGYGCEISPAYCDIIRRRWTKFARKHGLEEGTGYLDPVDTKGAE